MAGPALVGQAGGLRTRHEVVESFLPPLRSMSLHVAGEGSAIVLSHPEERNTQPGREGPRRLLVADDLDFEAYSLGAASTTPTALFSRKSLTLVY